MCPIDVKAIRDFIASPESLEPYENSSGKAMVGTYREHANKKFLNAIEPKPTNQDDDVWVTIKWRYSNLGERLVAAGIADGSRGYAIGFDPFKSWGRKMRYLALSRFGLDFDDSAAYPTASLHIIEEARGICKQFLDNEEIILKAIGAY